MHTAHHRCSRMLGSASSVVLMAMLAAGGCDSNTDKPKPSASDAKPSSKQAAPSTVPSNPTPPREHPDMSASKTRTWTFDDDAKGSIPKGFTVTETGAAGTPATWAIVEDAAAPTPPHAFAITKSTNTKATYNLALADDTRYDDVDIQVAVKAGTGQLDQGGGPVWRVRDTDNYYIARWNPLEKNARFYVVQSGVRSALAKVELDLDPQAWHALRVVMEGTTMELFIDDKPVLRTDDTTHTEPGQIGLWTKADAATSFDELSVATP